MFALYRAFLLPSSSSSSAHLALYLALRLAIVAFWALFLGPEPLSCWIVVMDDEYSGFQVQYYSPYRHHWCFWRRNSSLRLACLLPASSSGPDWKHYCFAPDRSAAWSSLPRPAPCCAMCLTRSTRPVSNTRIWASGRRTRTRQTSRLPAATVLKARLV